MLEVRASVPNLGDPAFAAQWRALAVHASPFLSWEWIGCLAKLRYPDPVLITSRNASGPVGLALFNRRRGRWGTRLHLHESGDPAQDAVFMEHNGVLARPEHQAEVLAATLACARRLASVVVLNGIDDAMLDAARAAPGPIDGLHSRTAPFLPLAPGGTLLPLLSRNTRAQLRRSDRFYAGQGPLTVTRAATVPLALTWLAQLMALHAETWAARGIESGFLAPAVQRFHQALVERGVPTGLVHLLRIMAGESVVGYLLNLSSNGHVAAYQSGFDYAGAGPHGKPGLTCHAAAIGHAWANGASEYDFLAGDSRYKRSFATGSRELHWLLLCQRFSPAGAMAAARRLLGR